MIWFVSRLRSLEFRSAVLLSTVLCLSIALSLMGLSIHRQLVSTIGVTGRLATQIENYAATDAQLRVLRIRLTELIRGADQQGPEADARWRATERAISAQRVQAARDDLALSPHGGLALARVRVAERHLVHVTQALMREVRADPKGRSDAMPHFDRALRSLSYWREELRRNLHRELTERNRQADMLARRALVEMTLAALLMLAVVGALILWLRWRIIGPLMTIVSAVRAMQGGKALPALTYAGRHDELGELTRALQAFAQETEQRERVQRQVEYLAHHDSLTGLANRPVFAERLAAALGAGQRVALLAIDLDGFKGVNDTLGHAAGDLLLKRASAILTAATDEGDVVARIGGDEFAIIHYLHDGACDAQALADRIFGVVAADSATPAIRLSIGIALSHRHGIECDELQACADIALYRAKADGRHRARHYDAAMDEERRQRHWLTHELRDASVRGELSLAFQPIADCASRRIIGQEALARWTHPVLGAISPDVFIGLAEENGLIGELGHYLLIEALVAARDWPKDWMLAINLSPVQLRDPSLAARILAAIADHGLDPYRIEVEVTEGVLIEQRETATANLLALRAEGVGIVMDDFGTGYSSLSSLQQFPFDKIKIDRSFIRAMDAHSPALSIVRASIGLGRSLCIPIVAEGVETEAQYAMLCSMGCDQIQGYLIGHPSIHEAQAA